MSKGNHSAPSNVLVMGGGRWARVITGVLLSLLPEESTVRLCSPHAVAELRAWIVSRGLSERIRATETRPNDLASNSAVIVANAAEDHVSAARWALSSGAAVLVEKPMALTSTDLAGLIADARVQENVLLPAHVYRFARYFRVFGHSIQTIGPVQKVFVEWVDQRIETRYGEVKTYSASVPLPVDVMPHIVSGLQEAFGILPQLNGPPVVSAGGSRVHVPLVLNSTECTVSLERNGAVRKRRIVATGTKSDATLDFSSEPGFLKIGSTTASADPFWGTRPTPLSDMLTLFFHAASGRPPDRRFGLETAEAACDIVDGLRESYECQRTEFLVDRLTRGSNLDDHLLYALNEVIQKRHRVSPAVLEREVARLRRTTRGISSEECMLLIEHLVGFSVE